MTKELPREKRYQHVGVILRKDIDKDIIEYIERVQAERGISASVIFKILVREEMKNPKFNL